MTTILSTILDDLESNRLTAVNILLTYVGVPEEGMTLKQRLSYYQLLEKE